MRYDLSMRVDHLYTSEAAAEIDRAAIAEHGYQGFDLMQAAGQAAFDTISHKFMSASATPSVLIVCGSGNNGGDGYIVGQAGLSAGWQVTLLAMKPPKAADAKAAHARFVNAGGSVLAGELPDNANDYHVVVDALLGIGQISAPRESFATMIRTLNALPGYKIALDVPTGINASTGHRFEACFQADITITFIVNKLGLHTGAALNSVGEVKLETLGLSSKVSACVEHCARTLPPMTLPKRAPDSHKGSYGSLLIAGADDGMLGAGLLAGEAALRAGCGKATLLSTTRHQDAAATYHPELMSLVYDSEMPMAAQDANAVAVGPGLGLAPWGAALLRDCLSLDKPTVVDADGLTLLAESRQTLPRQTVLTPHPGEAATLLGCSTRKVQRDRLAAAQAIAENYAGVCVLKGAGTVIANPTGEAWICPAGNPAMATAGMGDVLTGIMGALLAQGFDALEAAKTGAHWHALTADELVNRKGVRTLLASDVARALSTLVGHG